MRQNSNITKTQTLSLRTEVLLQLVFKQHSCLTSASHVWAAGTQTLAKVKQLIITDRQMWLMIYDTYTPCGPNPGLALLKLSSASPDSARLFFLQQNKVGKVAWGWEIQQVGENSCGGNIQGIKCRNNQGTWSLWGNQRVAFIHYFLKNDTSVSLQRI